MSLTHITDHVDQAQERQVVRWKGQPNEDKIIKIRVARLQVLENLLIDMMDKRAISNASGVQLDGIGEFYAEQGARSNRTDSEYRAYLQTLPARLRQAGQHEVLLQALVNLTMANSVETEYYWPRAMALIAVLDDITSITNDDEINDAMQAIRAQGVRLDIMLKPQTGAFLFSASDDGGVPSGSGFASLDDGSDGGKFIKLLG
jgi:hypothetical protein